jgi:hypothetical protein
MSLAELAPSIETSRPQEQKSFLEKADNLVEVLRRDQSLFELKRSGKSTKEAIETTSLNLSESEDQGFSESEKNLFRVIGHLGSYITSQRRVDQLGDKRDEGYRLNDREHAEFQQLRNKDLIPFNHAIKELIDTDSGLTKNELDASLARLYMRLFYRDDPLVMRDEARGVQDHSLAKAISSEALTSISVSSNGMRHEVAAESMLAAGGIDYDYNVNTEEDATGADMFVYIDGKWEYIDIKASEMSAKNALAKRRSSHAVWTGLHQSNFTGAKGNQVNGLRISFDEALKHSDAFVRRIRAVAHR